MHGGLIALTVITSILAVITTTFAIMSIITVCRDNSTGKCKHDDDCSNWEECIDEKCDLICADKTCGQNQHCVAHIHNYSCECLPGFERNDISYCALVVIRPYLREMITTTAPPKNTTTTEKMKMKKIIRKNNNTAVTP